jgi:hypothetical protein
VASSVEVFRWPWRKGSHVLELPESLYTSVYIKEDEVLRIGCSINGLNLGNLVDDDSAAFAEMESKCNDNTLFSLIQLGFDELYRESCLLLN